MTLALGLQSSVVYGILAQVQTLVLIKLSFHSLMLTKFVQEKVLLGVSVSSLIAVGKSLPLFFALLNCILSRIADTEEHDRAIGVYY